MKNTVKEQCSARVTYDSWCHTHQCAKMAVVERDGKPYCTVHDPEHIARKDAERTAKHNVEWAEKKAYMELQNTAVRACKEINPDNPMAVAESIKKLYEALKAITSQFSKVDKLYHKDNEIISQAEQALAKAKA